MIEKLELKVPPVVLLGLFAAGMWLTRNYPVLPEYSIDVFRYLSLTLGLAALIILLVSCKAFINAKTTIGPREPIKSQTLITNGLFGYSRNPIYLAFTLILIAWACWLANAVASLWLLGFINYLKFFQIKPEERYLTERFGKIYLDYCHKVRRWL